MRPGGRKPDLLIALNGLHAGRVAEEIAVDLFGAERAAAWEKDHWMRSRIRRRIKKAKRFLKERTDYRAMAARPG